MIEVHQLPHDTLVNVCGLDADQALVSRTLAAYEIRDERDRLFVLGLIPPCAISPLTFVWAKFDRFPRLGQLREFKRFIDSLDGLEFQTYLAEVCNPVSARFAEFMGFHYIGTSGDRQIYERRF